MAEPPEFWLFTVTNVIVFVLGSIVTMMSYLAYRSQPASRSFRNSTLGFAFITLGGAVEPIYQLGVRGDYNLDGREILAMQGAEGILIAVGLALLFFAITDYGRSRASTTYSTGIEDTPDQ